MKCFGKKCGACDWLNQHGNTADQKLVKSLRSQKRHLWLVNDKPGSGKNPTLKVFDSNHWNKGRGFGEQMAVVINTLDEDDEPFSLQGGSTATLTVEEDFFEKTKYRVVVRIDFKPRKYEYDAKLLKSKDWPCLDALLIDPGYDKILQVLQTGVSDDGDDDQGGDDDAPARKGTASRRQEAKDDDDDDGDEEETPRRSPKQEVEEDEDEDEEDEDEPKRQPVSKNGSHKKLKDDNEYDLDEDDGFGDDEEDDEDEPEPAPKKGKSRK